jgi:sugar phosphate isomerase/epimerase
MKLGFMIYSLGRTIAEGGLTVPQALALMRECGAEGVDVSDWNVQGHTNAEARAMVHDAGLAVSCYISGADLTTGPGPERSAALDHLRARLDDAVEVGGSTVLFTTGVAAEGADRAEARRNAAAGLAELLPRAADLGLTLTIEDFGALQSPYQTAAECLETCELAGPGLMLTYDTGNMVLGDEDPVAFLKAVAPKVVHAHAKDWRRLSYGSLFGLPSRAGHRYVGAVVGKGVINYPAVIAALKQMGYPGYLSFEYEGPEDQIQAARDGCAYLRSLIG